MGLGSVAGVSTGGFSLQSPQALSRRSRMFVSRLAGEKSSDRNQSPLLTSECQEGTSRTHRSRNGLSHSVHGSLSQSLHGVLNQSIHGDVKTVKTAKVRQADTLTQSLHRTATPPDLEIASSANALCPSPTKTQSMRFFHPKAPSRHQGLIRDDSSSGSVDSASVHRQSSTVPFFEKLCWACEKLDYPYEYADIVGSQFLGFESASPITHVDGHVPTMDELVEFLALAFIQIADFAHLTTIFLDDFQWLDAFSWRIFRVICSRAGKILLICATRSHDKQALRRITSAAIPDSRFQSQMIEISLGPLDLTDIRDLMSNVLVHNKSTIPDSLCSDIFQRTGGLPVYVVQLLKNIKRMRTLELVDGILQWTAEGLKEKVGSLFQYLCII
jgi:hypothetical protein